MNHRLSLLSILLAGCAFITVPSVAAETGRARANVNDDYTRIVFDFDKPLSYLTTQGKNTITLTFQKDINVSNLTSVSGEARMRAARAADARSVVLDFNSASDVRHFAIGNRIIVDVYGDKNKAVEKADAKTYLKTDVKKPEEKPPEQNLVKDADKKTETVKKPDETKVEIINDKAPDTVSANEEEPPAEPDSIPKGSALLSLTSAEAFGMAVYQKNGQLNLFIDREDFKNTPQISGDENLTKSFGDFLPQKIAGGTLFSANLPEGLMVRVEGGGSLWRVIVSDALENKSKAAIPVRGPGALTWATDEAGAVFKFDDPLSKDPLMIVPSETAAFLSGGAQNFVDVRLLPSFAGMAFMPKRDDLKVSVNPQSVVLTRDKGLNLSAAIKAKDLPAASEEKTANETPDATDNEKNTEEANAVLDTNRYFDFKNWQMGGVKKIKENRLSAMKNFSQKTLAEQADSLLTMAKMELANGMAAEAKAYLDFAVSLVPDLADTPTVKSLLGASYALMGQNDTAFANFSDERFKNNAEMQVWRAFTLANLEDWAQAGENLNDYPILLETYPPSVQVPLGLSLAEVALRQGDVKNADKILELISKHEKDLHISEKAAHDYLRGESDRQKGKFAEAKTFWQPLAEGHDKLYRVKAGLSLTNLELETKAIKVDEAINRLEGFRYTWRGDELEISTLSRLGRLYIDNGDVVKGLTMLRQAASLDPQSEQSGVITALMQKTYKDLFLTEQLDTLNPIDAVTLHTEFSELSPPDEEGDQIIERLAERLTSVDLLPRAASLLQAQIDSRLTGAKGADTAVKLAGIYTRDKKFDKALEALVKADEFLKPVPVDQAAPLKKEIALARAEAYGAAGKPDEAFNALGLLPQDEAVLRMRADIAWDNQRWQDTADALEQLASVLDISPSRPVTDEQGELLLNWALALHKADNQFVLNDMRDRFGAAMAASPLKDKFDVITRAKQNSVLVDRSSIDKMIADVDLFKTAGDVGAKVDAPVPAAAEPTAPVKAAPAAAASVPAAALTDQGEADVAGAEGEAGKTGATDAGSSAVP